MTMKTKIKSLLDVSSCYAGSVSSWHAFLRCWAKAEADNPLSSAGLPLIPSPPDFDTDASTIDFEISMTETRLGIKLPRSYKDFLTAMRPKTLSKLPHGDGDRLIGFFSPRQIDFGRVKVNALIQDITDQSVSTWRPEDYFVFGIELEDSLMSSENLMASIVVGKWDTAEWALVLLFPMHVTADGEYEAGFINHAGLYRAPCFAELIRQLSSGSWCAQNDMVGTCASLLSMKGVWWK
jgi:hypothetical protein